MAEYIDRESLVTDMQKRFCEDCDRRKGKKNGRVRFVYDIGDAPCRACWVDDAIGEIENYPTADVQPVVHGHWVKKPLEETIGNGVPIYAMFCSVCDWMGNEIDNYCSNCGADMREEET